MGRIIRKIVHLASVLLLVGRFCPQTSADWFNSTFIPRNNILINCGATGTSVGEGNRTWVGDVKSDWLPEPQNSEIHEVPLNGTTAVPFSTARIFTETNSYFIPVELGSNFVRLYFHRRDYREGMVAAFDVWVGGHVLLQGGLDGSSSEYARDGDDLNIVVREFLVDASSFEFIHLSFMPDSRYNNSYAFINGIEIVSAPYSVGNFSSGDSANYFALETMYRLIAGGSRVPPSDDSGLFREWTPDSVYVSPLGRVAMRQNLDIFYSSNTPAYIAPVAVYRTQRQAFNGLSWSMPVDPGFSYLVRLHLCGGDYVPSLTTFAYRRILQFEVSANMLVYQYLRPDDVPGQQYKDFNAVLIGQGEHTNLTINVRALYGYGTALNGLEVFKLIDNLGLGITENTSSVAKGSTTKDRNSKHSANKVIAAAVGGSLAIVSMLCFLLFRLLGGRSNEDNKSDANTSSLPWQQVRPSVENQFQPSKPPNPCHHFSYTEIEKATRGFNDELLLGVGGFGKVYRGNIEEGSRSREAAIKRAKPMSNQGVQEFRTEIEMLSRLRHRHLVSLIGFCEEAGEMILVYDYIAHGTLRQHLYRTNKPPLTWRQRLKICIGAARGLDYLHTGAKNPIIHRDVKSTNILLGIDWVAKVADFGLSKTSTQVNDITHVTTMVKGTFGYIDPEYFQCQQLTNKSDVYSFGVVLFEVLCARPAIDLKLPQEQVSLANWVKECYKSGTLQKIIDPYLQGHIAAEVFVKFAEIARKCLSNRGVNRPTMGEVLSSLEIILQLHDKTVLDERLGTNIACDGDDSNALLYLDNNEINHVSNCSSATITTTIGTGLAR